MSTTVRHMLAGKPDVYSVHPDASVFDALELMADRNVGALVVLRDGRLEGIFSERDYARKVILHGRASRDTPVREIMTSPVVCVDPAQSADSCMRLMTDKRIRHLPVLEHDQVIGVISIGDVVRAVLAEREHTIRSLESYIVSGA